MSNILKGIKHTKKANEDIANINNPDGWQIYKSKPAGLKENAENIIVKSIVDHIKRNRLDLLSKYGIKALMTAVANVAQRHANHPEKSVSDANLWSKEVENMLARVKNITYEEQLDEKCWDTHKQVGMKKKGGRMVPNCVPKESAIMKGMQTENDYTDFRQQLQHKLNMNPEGSAAEKMLLQRYIKTPMVQDFNLSAEEWIGQATKWLAVNQNMIKKNYPEVDTSDLIDLATRMYEDFLAMQGQLEETHSTGTTIGSAGIGGGSGIGIDKSPIEKVLEKPYPLDEQTLIKEFFEADIVEVESSNEDQGYKQALKDLQYFVDFIKYNSKTTSSQLKNMGPMNPGQKVIKKALGACDYIIKVFTIQKNQNIVSVISNIKNEILQWYKDGNKPLEMLLKASLSKITFPKDNTSEDTAYATGMGQGGNAGQSYRKYKPKAAGVAEEQAPMFTPEEKLSTSQVKNELDEAYRAVMNILQSMWQRRPDLEPKNDEQFLELAELYGSRRLGFDDKSSESFATALIPYWHDYHWNKNKVFQKENSVIKGLQDVEG
jgi:hypothetical protein